MSYLGNAPARSFISFERQVFTIVNSQTAYALSHSVTNENDIRLVVNNVVQEPGSGKAYTATGTALTLSAALTNGTDEMYCVFLGRATATSAPGAGSIGTAQLASDSVTLAKMASGTDGNIISYDASGNPVAVATGNDGQVLTSAGAGAPPVFETLPVGGSLILLSTTNVSSSVGQVNITSNIDSTYKNYLITITDYHPVTDNTFLNFRLFSSAGSPDTGSNYAYGTIGTRSDGNTSAQEFNSTGTTSGVINASNVGGDTRECTNATITLYNPSGTTYDKLIESSCVYADSSGRTCSSFNVNRYIPGSGIAYKGISFFPNSGNIITGVFKLYGIN